MARAHSLSIGFVVIREPRTPFVDAETLSITIIIKDGEEIGSKRVLD